MEKDVTVAAVMTAPRYECVAARNIIEAAIQGAGIPLTVSGGVYYSQCMQSMLEDLAGQDVDYVVTIDFDSVFTADHVKRLISLIVQESDIDAIAAVQPKRGCGSILASLNNETEVQWTGSPVQVSTAHFGLTVIDLRKLRDIPKPWFHATPQADGSWGPERTDADVHFWRQWGASGRSVYIDPGCRLGHLEEMVTYFDDQMQVKHSYITEWGALCKSTVD